jgi:hypothetical protein
MLYHHYQLCTVKQFRPVPTKSHDRFGLPNAVLVFQRFVVPSVVSVTSYAKTIPVTGLGGLWVCEMLRIPHCLDNRFTDAGKDVSPKHRPSSTPQKQLFLLLVFISVRS